MAGSKRIRGPVAYTFGYWGWGTDTKRLVKMVNQREASQGFEPPLWIDIRRNRQVRAPGFRDDAFAGVTGEDLYRWMPGLGNSALAWGGLEIANPREANELQDLIQRAHKLGRRTIFFCACRFRRRGQERCHRDQVARLVLASARRAGRRLTVVEWPGGAAEHYVVKVADRDIKNYSVKSVLPRSLVPERTPLLCPQGTALQLCGEHRQAVAFLNTPLHAKAWRYRVLEWHATFMSRRDIARTQSTIRASFGLKATTV